MQRRGPFAQQPSPPPAYSPAYPQPGLDAIAYGQNGQLPPVPAAPPPVVTGSVPVVASSRPGLLSGILTARRARPVAYAPPPPPPVPVIVHDPAYRLDAGDRLRVVVYGQEGLTNSYAVDAAGVITMPLIGSVSARGATPAELASAITARLRAGFIREPYVAVEIEAYRPFFILGEVTAPGQYPYVPNMTAESAVAIAGGYTPRAKRNVITITRTNEMGQTRIVATPQLPLKPGDTITVGERWF